VVVAVRALFAVHIKEVLCASVEVGRLWASIVLFVPRGSESNVHVCTEVQHESCRLYIFKQVYFECNGT